MIIVEDGIAALLDELSDAGVRVWLDAEGALRADPIAALSASMQERLRNKKALLAEQSCHECGDIRLLCYDAGGHLLCATHASLRPCTACGERSAFLAHEVCTDCVVLLLERRAAQVIA